MNNPEKHWKEASGFKSVTMHLLMGAEEIESMQKFCYDKDFKELGHSIYRIADTMINAYLKHKNQLILCLRLKAERFARDLKNARAVFLAGELFGPSLKVKNYACKVRKRLNSL